MRSNKQLCAGQLHVVALGVLSLGTLAAAARGEPGRQVSAPSGPAVPAMLPTTPMLGPFASLRVHCQELAKSGAGTCEPGRNRFARGWERGPRGPFDGATTLVVNRKLGPHSIKTCHVALRTARGFFVSADASICEGSAPGEQRTTALDSLHWVDLVGLGVLAANSSQLRRVRVEESRWWGEMSTESDVWESHSQLCGMTPSGVPACSLPLAIACGRDSLSPLAFEGAEIVSTASAETRRVCSGEVLRAGRYALPFTGIVAPLAAPLPAAEDTESPRALPLMGPFTSIRAYCADPATSFDPFGHELSAEDETELAFMDEEEEGAEPPAPYRWVADPLSSQAQCERRPGPWNTRKLRAPRAAPDQNELLAVDLLSMKGDMAGAPIQMCRIALTTKAGVFVQDTTNTCQGVIGPDSQAHTRVLNLRWLEVPSQGRIARLDIEQTIHDRQRAAIFCGVGPSGVPSCAGTYPLLCMNDDAAPVALDLRIEKGAVHASPSNKPPDPDLQSYQPCAELAAPMPLIFP